jgi:glycosyltransferase involved in cell wall biosynthesis
VSHEIRKTPFTPLIKRAETHVYREAALVSANNPAMAQYCLEASRRQGPVSVDLPPVDLAHFERPVGDLRARYGLSSANRVIAYMGSFFDFSGLDDVLPALRPAFDADHQLRLLLIGGGELEPRLRELRERLGLAERVIFTGIVPYAQLPEHLAIADVAINPFRSQLVTNMAFPHKVLQYMAAGIPAVSTSLRGLRGVLGDDAGVRWANDPSGVARVAVELLDAGPADRARIAAAQRAFVGMTFSREQAASGLERSILSVA